MTSKNIFLFGVLLLLLLMTVCSALFLDRYNPILHSPASAKKPTPIPSPSDEELFIRQIPIDTVTDLNLSQKEIPVETNLTMEQNSSLPRTIAAKIDYQRAKTVAQKQKKETKQLHTRLPSKPQKRVKRIQPSKKRILIEPVVLSKTLRVSDTGKLYRWDKPFLADIAQRVRTANDLYIRLKTASIGKRERSYLQNIRRYLLRHHVPKNRIKIVIEKRKSNIIKPEIGNNAVELSIIERI